MRVMFNDEDGNTTVQEFDYCAYMSDYSEYLGTTKEVNIGGLFLSSAADLKADLEPLLIPMSKQHSLEVLHTLWSKGCVSIMEFSVFCRESLLQSISSSKRGGISL